MITSKVDFKVDGLEKIQKALGKKLPQIRVGIMGANAARSDDTNSGLTNAQIGFYHEFGTSKLPMRSFLRMPLAMFLNKRLEQIGSFASERLFGMVLRDGGFGKLFSEIASVAESIVIEAFDTGGFGRWPKSNMKNKKNFQTLIETGQVRDSITSEVK